MRAVALLLLAASAAGDDYLANWMGNTMSVIGDRSVLDLALPGTHDTLTYDLTKDVADDTNDLPTWAAWILHTIGNLFDAASFIRDQAITQGLTVTEQLDNGMRFLDMRMTWTAPPGKLGDYDWYSIHLVESKKPIMSYMTEVRDWLVAHPNEVVAMWVTKHGSSCPTGTTQYPGTTPEIKQALWAKFQQLFGKLLFDNSVARANETTVRQMVARGQRLIMYVADYEEFTGGSTTLAYDACKHLDNNLHGGSLSNTKGAMGGWTNALKGAKAKRAQLKAQDKFFLQSYSSSPPGDCTKDAALIKYTGIITRKAETADCAKQFNMPGVTDWCPMTLEEEERVHNYYAQRIFDLVNNESSGLDFPGAIYINVVAEGGLIRTGANKVTDVVTNATAEAINGDAGWAYAPSMILWSVRRACKAKPSDACSAAEKQLLAMVAANPVKRWDEPATGRLANWP